MAYKNSGRNSFYLCNWLHYTEKLFGINFATISTQVVVSGQITTSPQSTMTTSDNIILAVSDSVHESHETHLLRLGLSSYLCYPLLRAQASRAQSDSVEGSPTLLGSIASNGRPAHRRADCRIQGTRGASQRIFQKIIVYLLLTLQANMQGRNNLGNVNSKCSF